MRSRTRLSLFFLCLVGVALSKAVLGAEFPTPTIDPLVTTSRGDRLHFYKDIVQDKVAVIQFIYTSCRGVCVHQGQSFVALSKSLGARLNKDVVLISISIDPGTDTPERLEKWASQYGAHPPWTLLTGTEAEIRPLIRTLVGDVTPGSHDATAVFLYQPKKSVQTEYGLASPETFIKRIDALEAR